MWPAMLHANFSVVFQIVEAAARTIVLACFAGAALRAMRAEAVLDRLRVWQAVLVVALAMPLLGSFAPQLRVPIPVPEFTTPTASRVSITDSVIAVRELRPTGRRDALARTSREAAGTPYVVAPSSTAAAVEPSSSGALKEEVQAPVRASNEFLWIEAAVAIYFVISLLLLMRIVIGVACGDRLAQAAKPIKEATALDALSSSKQAAGLRGIPRLVESDAASVPLTLRVSDPVILLPPTWREWDQGELRAVLAHEISHVARRDALVQRLALIHRAIFWFSPFAWWLERHLADLAEQASDESALECGVDRVRYAETLLGFFAAVESAPERVWWQGVAMAKAGQAEKRVDRILAWRGAMTKQLKKSLVVFLAAGAVAAVAFSASVHPSLFSFQQTAPPPPAVPPEPAPTPHPEVNPGPAPQAPSVEPITPAAPRAAVAPIAPTAPPASPIPVVPAEQDVTPEAAWPSAAEIREARQQLMAAKKTLQAAREQLLAARAQLSDPATKQELESVERAVRAYSKAMANYQSWMPDYSRSGMVEGVWGGVYGDIGGGLEGGVKGGIRGGIGGTIHDSEQRFVIVTKGSDSVTMSGDSEDEEHAKSLRSKIPGDFIWFERDEKSYIIRDQATVDKAKALWKPQEELGKQQEALGRQQEALGKQQEALGQKMEQVRVKIPDMTAELQKLEAKMKELSANGGTMSQIGDLQSEIGELQSRIGEIQSDAGRQQSEIGREQGELGREQGELGRQQGELGRRQGELAQEASRQMKQLLDEAITKGTAQPE